MKKSQYIAAISIIAAAMGGYCAPANAQSADEQLAPLIYILLDTSGSMNDMVDSATNNTRLTKAIAELTGSMKLGPNEALTRPTCPETCPDNDTECKDCPKKVAFKLPFPVWTCTSTSCNYTYQLKDIPRNAEIAKPNGATTNVSDVETYRRDLVKNYREDGIIQAYQSAVKFGAAGLAVGSKGSSSDKDAGSILEAVSLAGGDINGELGARIIWNHIDGINSDSDLDFHCAIYRNGNWIDKIDYCYLTGAGGNTFYDYGYGYYTFGSDTGGVLDVDIIYPETGSKRGQPIRVPELSRNKLGVENITWSTVDKLQIGDELYFYVVPYWMHNNMAKGFKALINIKDYSGCDVAFSFDYTADISGRTSNDTCGGSILGSGDIYYPIAKLVYKGRDAKRSPKFEIASIGSFAGKTSTYTYKNLGGAGDPDNIYGFSKAETAQASGLSDVTLGRSLSTDEFGYKHPTDCTLDIGMWDSSIKADAPLFYPTPARDKDSISTSNARLIDALRTYQAHSATPIGEALADMYYMLGLDSSNYNTVDKGLVVRKDVTQPDNRIVDEAYACRDKAVILITDGTPNGSGISGDDNGSGLGHGTHIWYDADWLNSKSQAKPVKTYVIAYAFGDSAGENIEDQDPAEQYIKEPNGQFKLDKNGKKILNPAYILNMTAWKGGTCRHPVTHKPILPDDEREYEAMVEIDKDPRTRKPIAQRRCFYSAANGTALRKAMAEALSDTLQGTVSKTAVASSSALGYVKNIHEGKYSNGYYNVYSGYEITPGLVRRSILQRESTICNSSSGKFEAGKQHMDLSTILSCRLNKNCMSLNENSEMTSAQERTQIAKDIANKPDVGTPCALHGSNGVTDISGNTNTCLSNRYIFAGDYSEDRYKIHPDIVSINPKTDPGSTDAGVPKGIGFVKNAAGSNRDENYIINKGKVENIHINQMYSKGSANYVLSPYECGSDLDCVKEGKEGYCDLGRCVTGNEYNSATTCYAERYTNTEVCIDGKIRKRYTGDDACDHHFSEAAVGDAAEKKGCGEGLVCHAGKCLPGTVIGGNLRNFMATMPLGTIEYATPVTVEPPTRTVKSANYLKFSQQRWNRDNMLLVAANDGMLHAFILGQNQPNSSGYEVNEAIRGATETLRLSEGDELWAFVPKTTMPHLEQLPRFGQQTFLNASPMVMDVPNPNDEWRTVAVGAFGNGARGYYALDITDPLNPEILWEIDNQWQAASVPSVYPDMSIFDSEVYSDESALINNIKTINPGNNMGGFPFADMGYTSAKPLITRMLVKKTEGENVISKVETVAILPGGSRKVPKEGAGVLYIVRLFPDPDTKDLLIAAIYTKHDITSAPAVYPSNFNSIAQRLYFGDSKGNFYALDVSNFEPAKWAKNSFPTGVNVETDSTTKVKYLKPSFGSDCGHVPDVYKAITYKPAVSLYNNGIHPTIQIVYGTGDNSDLTTTTAEHNYVAKFFDVYEGTSGYQLNPATGLSEPAQLYVFNQPSGLNEGTKTVTSNACNSSSTSFDVVVRPPSDPGSDKKKEPFPAAQKMSGSALTYDFDSYFPTYISNTSSKGDYDKLCEVGNAAIFKMNSTHPKHSHIPTGSVQNNENNSDIMAKLNSNGYITLNEGTKIYGLEVSSQQMCIGTNHTEIAAPRLIAQTGVSAADLNASDKHNELNDSSTDIANFALNLDAIAPSVRPVSWASVYE